MSGRITAIVGAGPAGIAAAIQLKRSGFIPRLLDSRGMDGCGLIRNGFKVENYPGLVAPVSGAVLMKRFLHQLLQLELNICKDTIVEIKKEKSNSFVLHGKSNDYKAETVIIASGTTPRKLPLDSVSGLTRRIHYNLKELVPELQGSFASTKTGFSDSRQRAEESSGQSKEIVVVGGGEAAQDYSLSLTKAGFRVKLLIRGTRLKGNLHLKNAVISNQNIELCFERSIKSVVRCGNSLEITTSSKNQLEIWKSDNMVVAIGRQVEQYFGLSPELFANGQIITPLSGLFQIGDFRLGSLGQVGMAVGDGLRVASLIAHY